MYDQRMRRQRSPYRAARSKESQRLIAAIEDAGGRVSVTARGHFRVVGPRGVAFVGSAPPRHGQARANLLGDLRRYAGLDVQVG